MSNRHPAMLSKRREEENAFTFAEKKQIASTSLHLMNDNQAMTRLEAVRMAVETLPSDRRRYVRDMFSVDRWIKPLWAELADELDAQQTTNDAHLTVESPVQSAAKNEEPETAAPLEESKANIETSNHSTGVTLEGDEMPRAANLDGVNIDGPKRGRGRPSNAAKAKEPFLGKPDAEQVKAQGEPAGRRIVVRWREDERRTVAKAYIQQRADFPDMSESEAFRKAMKYSLPDDRQRQIAGISMERDWLEPLIVELRAEHERETLEREARRAQEYEEEQARIAQETAEREAERQRTLAAELERIRDMQRAATEAVEGLTLSELQNMIDDRRADVMAEKVFERLMGPLTALIEKSNADAVAKAYPFKAFERAAKEAIPESERAAPAPREHKPRVLICGVLNEWVTDLKREFDATLNLDFFKSAHEGPDLEPKLKHKDLVVHMIEHSGGDREAIFRRAGVKPMRCAGGVAQLKKKLRAWLLNEPVSMAA